MDPVHVLEFEPVKLYVTDIELSWCGWDMGSWQILAKTWAQHVGSSLRDRGPSADVPAPAGRILVGGFSVDVDFEGCDCSLLLFCSFLDWLAFVKFLRTDRSDRIKLLMGQLLTSKHAFIALEFSVLFVGQPHPVALPSTSKHCATVFNCHDLSDSA